MINLQRHYKKYLMIGELDHFSYYFPDCLFIFSHVKNLGVLKVVIGVCGWCLQAGNIGQVNYAASKAGVEGLTKTAAKEFSRWEESSKHIRAKTNKKNTLKQIRNSQLISLPAPFYPGLGFDVIVCCQASYQHRWQTKFQRRLLIR